MAAAGKQKEISMGYPAHSTEPKTTLYLNLRYSANQKTDLVSLPRAPHEAENNSLSQSPDTPRIKKLISFRYLGHSTKPKTTFCLNLQTLRETKNEYQFRSPGTMQSEKRISILTSEYSGSKK